MSNADERFDLGLKSFVVGGFGVTLLTKIAPALPQSETILAMTFNGAAVAASAGMVYLGAAGLKKAITNTRSAPSPDRK